LPLALRQKEIRRQDEASKNFFKVIMDLENDR